MAKYKYALTSNGDLVDIKSLSNDDNSKNARYVCISCGNDLIPKLGCIKEHHFAHKTTVDCNSETYLHKLGKLLFYNAYVDSLGRKVPFKISIEEERFCNSSANNLVKECYLGVERRQIDLTKYFNIVEIEKGIDNFVADILLSNSRNSNKLLVEVVVSHFCDKQKIDSNLKIIEITANTENDFECIRNRELFPSENIAYYNFDVKQIRGDFCNGKCKKEYDLFVLEKDGRSYVQTKSYGFIKNILNLKTELIAYYDISEASNNGKTKYVYYVAKTHSENRYIKNCFICRYRALNKERFYYYDEERLPIFCKFLKERCKSTKAVECSYYRVEESYVVDILELDLLSLY